jgi:hypothetical protein
MKTIDEVANYLDLWSRCHPDVTNAEFKSLTLSLVAKLPFAERKKFIEEYYKWADEKYAEEFPDEYLDRYRETNEAA